MFTNTDTTDSDSDQSESSSDEEEAEADDSIKSPKSPSKSSPAGNSRRPHVTPSPPELGVITNAQNNTQQLKAQITATTTTNIITQKHDLHKKLLLRADSSSTDEYTSQTSDDDETHAQWRDYEREQYERFINSSHDDGDVTAATWSKPSADHVYTKLNLQPVDDVEHLLARDDEQPSASTVNVSDNRAIKEQTTTTRDDVKPTEASKTSEISY